MGLMNSLAMRAYGCGQWVRSCEYKVVVLMNSQAKRAYGCGQWMRCCGVNELSSFEGPWV